MRPSTALKHGVLASGRAGPDPARKISRSALLLEAHDARDARVRDLRQELYPVQDQPQPPLRLVADPLHRHQGPVVEHASVDRVVVGGVHGLLAVDPPRRFHQLLVRELPRAAHAPEQSRTYWSNHVRTGAINRGTEEEGRSGGELGCWRCS
jgi:hypothetical protein